jgi:DNA-binding transcriptional MerR regulator
VTSVDESLVVFTLDRVSRLTGFTLRQLTYWATTELIQPTVDRRLTPQRPVRLYSWDDVLSLLIIAELRRQKMSPQYVRQIVQHVRRTGFKMAHVEFAIAGSRVHFRAPDGDWEDADRPQPVLSQVLDLEPLKAQLRDSVKRTAAEVGQTERRRGAMGSKLLVAGTRIPVSAVQRFLDRGVPVAEILEAYPSLERRDIEVIRGPVDDSVRREVLP